MIDNRKRTLLGALLLAAFVLWTILIQHVDVQKVGPRDTEVGFATFNVWFHQMAGVHMLLYAITDWLGLVPIFVCVCFGFLGLVQLIKRRSLFKVDLDILLLGIYYVLVILGYLLFEMVPINYRPILIDGHLEASYPSSTTLLVLSVMPTLVYQAHRRITNPKIRHTITIFAALFSIFMVVGRLVSGVHWATDIIGSVLLSSALFLIYESVVGYTSLKKKHLKSEASDGV